MKWRHTNASHPAIAVGRLKMKRRNEDMDGEIGTDECVRIVGCIHTEFHEKIGDEDSSLSRHAMQPSM